MALQSDTKRLCSKSCREDEAWGFLHFQQDSCVWKVPGIVREWPKAIDCSSMGWSHILFSPHRTVRVCPSAPGRLDPVCSCAEQFFQLFWRRARCKMKSMPCALCFTVLLFGSFFVPSPLIKNGPSYPICGPVQ